MKQKTNIFILFFINIYILFIITSGIGIFLKYQRAKYGLTAFYDSIIVALYLIIFFICLVILGKYYLFKYKKTELDFHRVILLNKNQRVFNYLFEKNIQNNFNVIFLSILSIMLFFLSFNSLMMKLLLNKEVQNFLISFVDKINAFLHSTSITINFQELPKSNNFTVYANNVRVDFLLFIIFVFLGPLIEEFIFRYVFYRVYDKKNFILINSIIFFIYHIGTFNILTLISAFYLSYFFLSRVYYYKKNLMLNIIIHSFFNLFALIYAKFFYLYFVKLNYGILFLLLGFFIILTVFSIVQIKARKLIRTRQ